MPQRPKFIAPPVNPLYGQPQQQSIPASLANLMAAHRVSGGPPMAPAHEVRQPPMPRVGGYQNPAAAMIARQTPQRLPEMKLAPSSPPSLMSIGQDLSRSLDPWWSRLGVVGPQTPEGYETIDRARQVSGEG